MPKLVFPFSAKLHRPLRWTAVALPESCFLCATEKSDSWC